MEEFKELIHMYLYLLSEGNAGSISILRDIITNYPEDCGEVFEKLDKHDIRGSNMWVLYKQFDKNTSRFIEHVKSLSVDN